MVWGFGMGEVSICLRVKACRFGMRFCMDEGTIWLRDKMYGALDWVLGE
jgi:hypothetical protein